MRHLQAKVLALVNTPTYSKDLADCLNIPNGAKRLNEVSHYGQGGSFGDQNKSGHANQMEVFTR